MGRELPFGEASGRCIEEEEERGRVGEMKDVQRDMEREKRMKWCKRGVGGKKNRKLDSGIEERMGMAR